MNVLEEAYKIACKHWNRGKGVKVGLIIGCIGLVLVLLIGGALYLLVSVVKGLEVGRIRNLDLYIPKFRRF